MIIRNETAGRFEARIGGQLAVAEYRIEDRRMIFTRTFVPPELRGRGIAEKLVRAGFAAARAEGLAIVPECGYVARLLERHPEFQKP
ncbi:MAG TPA: GNAT family N-acetyltransferase [Chthoniobacterales bacterium]